jgi:hypothetical protein
MGTFLDVLWCRHAIMSDGSKEMRVMLFRREPADRIARAEAELAKCRERESALAVQAADAAEAVRCAAS